jgi:hypothetical protein
MARTEQLNELLSLFRDDLFSRINTLAIAKVTAIRNQKTIDCKIVVNIDSELEWSNFSDIPVYFAGGGGNYIAFAISVGDYCLLATLKQPVDNFRLGKDFVAADSRRLFDPSDVIALVGIKPDANLVTIPQEGIVYQGNGAFNGNQTINGDVVINGTLQVNGKLTVNDDIKVTGDLNCDGSITAQDAILNGISFSSHVHPFIDANGTPKVTQGPQ